MQILKIAQLRQEGAKAAHGYGDINAACPYPFGTDYAHHFAIGFDTETAWRATVKLLRTAAATTTASTAISTATSTAI